LAMWNGATPHNKGHLLAVRDAVTPGMTKEQLERLLATSKAPLRKTWKNPDALSIAAPIGFLDSVYLEIDFHEGRVAHVRVRGDGGELVPEAASDF